MFKKLVGAVLAVSLVALFSGCEKPQPEAQKQVAAPVAPQKTYTLRLAETWPPNFPVFQVGVEQFAKDIASMSGGRLNIQVYAGGELVPALQSFDAVSQGTVEMAHGFQ